jgi:YVTN family beta-propeller protein
VATDSILATVDVGVRPWGIALSRDGRKLYTANGPSNDVTVVDTESMKVLKKIPAGELPWGVVVGRAP